jgi:hypothetical protein
MQVSHQGMKFGTEFLMKSRAVESIKGPSERGWGANVTSTINLAEIEGKASYLKGLDLLLAPTGFSNIPTVL